MEGWVPIFFLMVILKIPVGFLLYIVWWAFRAQPELEEAPEEGGEHGFRRFRPDPTGPHGPRRGPHAPDAMPLPACPPAGRTRAFTPAHTATPTSPGAARPSRWSADAPLEKVARLQPQVRRRRLPRL